MLRCCFYSLTIQPIYHIFGCGSAGIVGGLLLCVAVLRAPHTAQLFLVDERPKPVLHQLAATRARAVWLRLRLSLKQWANFRKLKIWLLCQNGA